MRQVDGWLATPNRVRDAGRHRRPDVAQDPVEVESEEHGTEPTGGLRHRSQGRAARPATHRGPGPATIRDPVAPRRYGRFRGHRRSPVGGDGAGDVLEETGFSTGSTTPSGRRWSATPRPFASWPAPGRARPACSPGASPGGCPRAPPSPPTSSPSPSPAGPRPSCGARLSQLGVREQVAAGTFHSIAYGQLRRWWADNDERPPAVLDSKIRMLAKLDAQAWAVTGARAGARAGRRGRRDRVGQGPPGAAPPATRRRRWPPVAGRRFRRAPSPRCTSGTSTRSGAGTGSTSTTSSCCAPPPWRTIVGSARPSAGASVTCSSTSSRTSTPCSSGCWRRGATDRPDLCVVGDPNQAIYAWNGADAGYLTGFRQRYPGAEVVRLDDNYRSSPQVLAVANAVLDGSPAAGGDRAVRRRR